MSRLSKCCAALLVMCCPAVGVSRAVDPYDHPLAKPLLPAQHVAISQARALVLTKMGCTIQQFSDTAGLDGVVSGPGERISFRAVMDACFANAAELLYGSRQLAAHKAHVASIPTLGTAIPLWDA
jgi:hypothetical protein